jgi:hypothetical protein
MDLPFYKLCKNGFESICSASNHKAKSIILNRIITVLKFVLVISANLNTSFL